MRGVFGLVGLVVTVAIVGLLVKKQLHTSGVVPTVPAVAGVSTPPPAPGATVQQQSQQIQQQYKQSVENAMQPPPRSEPDGK